VDAELPKDVRHVRPDGLPGDLDLGREHGEAELVGGEWKADR
jgi:hypothetical protein